MKTNVDLTENRVFSNPLLKFKITLPWQKCKIFDVKLEQSNLLKPIVNGEFITGNREERTRAKFEYKMREEYDITCDRCGKKIYFPDGQYHLCKKCEKEISKKIAFLEE